MHLKGKESKGKSFTLHHMTLFENYSLQNLNTFGLPARARYFVSAGSLDELKEAILFAKSKVLPLLPLGGGSNILLRDDYPGLVLHVNLGGLQSEAIDEESVLLTAGAGVEWHELVLYAVGKGFGGIENLSLIPGKAGAAPIQNIGAYGVELKDVFHSLLALDLETLKSRVFTASECRFGYRDSFFKQEGKGRFIITSLSLKLQSKNYFPKIEYAGIREVLNKSGIENPGIKEVSDAIIKIRKAKLPDPAHTGNAGSFFKNPVIDRTHFQDLKNIYPGIPSYPWSEEKVKIPAAWLIEKSGWKGKSLGKAATHARQPLVLINLGGAKGEDIIRLSEKIQDSVREKFGISLEREVNII